MAEGVKETKKRSKGCDWVVPKLEGDLASEDCSQSWDTSKINMFDDLQKCNLDQVMTWQWGINKRFSSEDRIAGSRLK